MIWSIEPSSSAISVAVFMNIYVYRYIPPPPLFTVKVFLRIQYTENCIINKEVWSITFKNIFLNVNSSINKTALNRINQGIMYRISRIAIEQSFGDLLRLG